ncbi:helix-turn-helix domain-containing protein [Catenulispora sp. NF23]|uniref:helix-turn-helix domain-containing protein n=1 Tax=Catenulispora pinistramenti TaxID=2705254 RepID=UPI001BA8BA8D|nr:helix-turn-helix domain-containing protein [Catenulispora pinistramenti]MBS2538855.1 helix-turn-helix domain-containing protein [Catenulispora pinistramenti]
MPYERNAQERTQGPSADSVRRKPYRVAEVAAFLDVDVSTVYKDIDAGRLRALRVGSKRGTLRILPPDLDAYLAAMATAAAGVTR